jgi:hypothetical protein
VLLDGEFSWFDAEVGLQPCGAGGGSVVFRVFVDGEMCFSTAGFSARQTEPRRCM